MAEGGGDIIAAHLYFPPEPPSRHASSVPAGVEQLVLLLLQKEPRLRPDTAAAVISAIDNLGPLHLMSLPSSARLGVPSRSSSVPLAGHADTTLGGAASPAGEEVWFEDKRLGIAPLSLHFERASSPRTYLLRAAGFADAMISMSGERDERRAVTMRKKSPSPLPPSK